MHTGSVDHLPDPRWHGALSHHQRALPAQACPKDRRPIVPFKGPPGDVPFDVYLAERRRRHHVQDTYEPAPRAAQEPPALPAFPRPATPLLDARLADVLPVEPTPKATPEVRYDVTKRVLLTGRITDEFA